ncbi:unnamed protein product [Effrenium voratum]|nr:unnamed protein product [Effrenium voratum]
MRIMLPHEEFDFKVTADAAVLADTVVFPVVAKILATKLRITALQQRLAEELLRMRQTEGSHWKLEPQDVPEFFDLGGLVSLEHGALGADPQNPLAMRASTCISARTFPQQARWKRQSLWQLAIQPQLFDGSHGAPMLSLVSALPTGLPRTPLSNVTTWVATYVQKVHPSQLEVVLLAVCVAEVLHFSASPAQELQVFAAFPNAQPVLRACMTLLCNPGGVIAAQAAIELGDGAAHVRLAPLWADLGRPFVGGMPRLSLRGHGDVLASLCFFVLDLSKVISGHNPPTMSIELAAASLALCAGLSPTREPWDLDPIVLPLVLPLVLDSEHLAAFLWTFPTSPQTGQVRQLDEFAAMIWLHSCFGLKMTSLYQPEWKPFSWKSAMPFEVDVALSRASLVNLFVIQLDVSEQTLATQPRLVKAVLRQAWQEETRLQIATGWFLWAECAAGFDWLVLISRKAPLHCFVLRVAEDRRKRRPTVAFAAVPVGQAVSRCALNRAKASLLLLGRPTVSRKLMPLRITQLFQPPGTLWAIGLSRTSWFVLKALDMQTGSPLSKAHQAHLLSALPEPAVLAGVVSQPRLVKAVLRQAWPEETRLQIATGWLLWAECAAGFDWLVLISRKAPLHCFVLRVAEDRRKRRPTVAFAAVPVGQAVSRCALNRAKASLLLLGRPTVSRKLMPLRLLQRPITQLFQPLGTLWAIGLSRTSWFVLKALDMQTGSPLSTAHQAHLLSALPEPAVLAGVVSQPRLVKAVLRQAWPEETRLQIATGWFLWAECAAGFDLLVLFSLNGGAPLQSHIAKIEPHVAATFEHDAALGATILAALMGSRSRRLEWIQDCQQVLLGSLIQSPGPNASSLRKAMLERPGHGPSEVQEQHALLPWKFYAMGGARCNEGAGLVVVNELSVAPLSTPSLPAWRMLKPPKSRIWASATVLLSRAPLLRALTFVKAVPRQSRRENLRVHLGLHQRPVDNSMDELFALQRPYNHPFQPATVSWSELLARPDQPAWKMLNPGSFRLLPRVQRSRGLAWARLSMPESKRRQSCSLCRSDFHLSAFHTLPLAEALKFSLVSLFQLGTTPNASAREVCFLAGRRALYGSLHCPGGSNQARATSPQFGQQRPQVQLVPLQPCMVDSALWVSLLRVFTPPTGPARQMRCLPHAKSKAAVLLWRFVGTLWQLGWATVWVCQGKRFLLAFGAKPAARASWIWLNALRILKSKLVSILHHGHTGSASRTHCVNAAVCSVIAAGGRLAKSTLYPSRQLQTAKTWLSAGGRIRRFEVDEELSRGTHAVPSASWALMGSRSRRLEWIQDCQQVLLGSLIQAPGPNASRGTFGCVRCRSLAVFSEPGPRAASLCGFPKCAACPQSMYYLAVQSWWGDRGTGSNRVGGWSSHVQLVPPWPRLWPAFCGWHAQTFRCAVIATCWLFCPGLVESDFWAQPSDHVH